MEISDFDHDGKLSKSLGCFFSVKVSCLFVGGVESLVKVFLGVLVLATWGGVKNPLEKMEDFLGG